MSRTRNDASTPPPIPPPGGAVVVVSKCPIPGKSKTRLIPLLGAEGSAELAEAMLSDVLLSIDGCGEGLGVATTKVLLYAPGTDEGRSRMGTILDGLGIPWVAAADDDDDETGEEEDEKMKKNAWRLVPMTPGVGLRSSDLGGLLEHALVRCRRLLGSEGAVVFLGMDSPVLPLEDIAAGLADREGALLCPADDGGYGMLSVPPAADARATFRGVHWSHPLTAVSQAKALTDQGIPVRFGALMHDCDEPGDAERLCERLFSSSSSSGGENAGMVLGSGAGGAISSIESLHPAASRTRAALEKAGLHKKHE